jgi:hypothetical protein
MAHSPSLIFNAIAEKTLQQNPFPPAEDFKLLPLFLLVSACSSSTRERGEKPNQKVTITTGGRKGRPKIQHTIHLDDRILHLDLVESHGGEQRRQWGQQLQQKEQ